MVSDEVVSTVIADINYFSRAAKFEKEKPFVTSFPIDGIEGACVSNHVFDVKRMKIHDVRAGFTPLLNTHGFTYLTAKTAIKRGEFDSEEIVRSHYFSELKSLLQSKFREYTAFAFFDYELRKRSSMYPKAVGAKVAWAQPLAQAHVDYTVKGAVSRLEISLSGEQKDLLSKPCDLLNVWRPLKGPNDDWPLALCDFRSINIENDLIPNDVVYENSVGEDEFLRSNDSHEWYYMSRHTVDEVVVWRNTNLPNGEKPRAFHTAFEKPNSNADASNLRESIEVRVAAFF